jgi:hypothetical protein
MDRKLTKTVLLYQTTFTQTERDMKTILSDNQKRQQGDGESGNILFLILIAVALFAALSYAVTQSSRSSGGDVSGEKTLVSSSELTQYPAGIRTSILRMIVDTGLTPDQLLFDVPSNFAPNGTASITDNNDRQAVFHPLGGGETYEEASPDIMASGAQGIWHFNANYQIQNIGLTDTGDTNGNDVVAFLDGVSKGVCQSLDTQLGLGTIPVLTTPLDPAVMDTDQLASAAGSQTSTFPTTTGVIIGASGSDSAMLAGQPFACFQNGSTGNYVYYHVIIER